MMRKKTIGMITLFGLYIALLCCYFFAKAQMEGTELSFRFWVDLSIWFLLWSVPLIVIGIWMFGMIQKIGKSNKVKRIFGYTGLGASVIVALFAMFSHYMMKTQYVDSTMTDGNLLVTESSFLEPNIYTYAEPVGIFLRREIIYDDERYAESLSKMYDAKFTAQNDENGTTVFVSDVYPQIQVTVLGIDPFPTAGVKDTLKYQLTSQALVKHKDILDDYHVELVPIGSCEAHLSSMDIELIHQQNIDTVYAVLIHNDNAENIAKALATFIHTTLQEDVRADGKSLWDDTEGSIYLIFPDDGYRFRNIPFSHTPEYPFIYDENVDAKDISHALGISK